MKTWIYSLILAVFAFSSVGQAAPLCTNASLQDYLDMSTPCEIGDKQFFDFVYVGIVPIAVAPDEISVDPITGPNVGLRFSGPFEVDGIDLVSETFFAFRVATLSGLPTIRRANMSAVATFDGLGAVSVAEQVDDGSLLPRNLNVRTSLISTQLTDTELLIPTNAIRVTKDIFLTSGLLGRADLDSVDQTFEQAVVPEPSTALLAIPALLCMAGAAWRRRR